MPQEVVVSSRESELAKALRDLREGAMGFHLWSMLAWLEIRIRDRRSVIGPFWLTLSTGAMLVGMGPLYSSLLGQDLRSYFPYLAVSFIVWQLLTGLVNEGCYTFIAAEGLIKQNRLPLFVHVLRVVWRNLIVFAHHSVIIFISLLLFPPPMSWTLLSVPLGLLAIALNGIWIGAMVGMLCARFRDATPIVQSLMQVAFFLTPVLWQKQALRQYQWAVDMNPLHHFLDIVRAPLIMAQIPWVSWAVVAAMTVAGFGAALALYIRCRSRIALWI